MQDVYRLNSNYTSQSIYAHISYGHGIATIIDNATNKVILHHEFNEVVDAESDDPVGGVTAANLAVNKALEKLSIFCQQAAIAWQTPKSNF